MKNFSKKHVTLLEILIAMTLTSVILITLMYFYKQIVVIGSDIDKIQAEELTMRFMEKRLTDIFPNIVSPSEKKDFAFLSVGDEGIAMSNSQSLIFTFDNGNCQDKRFSNIVVGRLILDPQGNLFLMIWPLPRLLKESHSDWPVKKEVLLSHVESLKFEFFIPLIYEKPTSATQNQDKNSEKSIEPEPKGGWRREPWLQEFNQLPVMTKVIITMKKNKESIIFIFQLPAAKAHIIYE